MALGNPSGAAANVAMRTNYLIARSQYALSYNDDTHQANWVSWSYNSPDTGSSGRTDAWSEETELPVGYLKIGTSTFGTGWDRGHMCPSGDRTLSVADNEFTFRMSNMIPQASLNNQGLWANFESYCRSLSSDGSEILITSGPSDFSGATISNGMQIPGSVWKIVLKVQDSRLQVSKPSLLQTSSMMGFPSVPNIFLRRKNPPLPKVAGLNKKIAPVEYWWWSNAVI